MTLQQTSGTCQSDKLPDAEATCIPYDRSVNRVGFMRCVGLATGAIAIAGVSNVLVGLHLPATAVASGKGQLLGSAKALGPNQAMAYTDPATGDPALLIRLMTGQLVSYDAVCTHAGCTVGYDPGKRLMACPCHGALFDPAHSATVMGGPAPSPLSLLAIRVDSHENVYALDGKSSGGVSTSSSKLHPSTTVSGTGQDDRGDEGTHKYHRRQQPANDD